MKALKWIAKILGVSLVILIVIVAIFLIYRVYKTNKVRKEHHIVSEQGVDEEITLQVGGIPQHLYMRGQDTKNPVILFLHGGPGGAMSPMLYTYQYLWEDDYTVVNWDQRVSGKTYFLNKDNIQSITDTLSTEVLLEDAIEIIHYLNERFGKEKVILVGHSWGTVLGSQLALKHPELVEAYVGVGQVVNVNDGVLKMGEYTHQKASKASNKKDIVKLEKIIEDIQNRKMSIVEEETIDIYKIAKKYMPVNMDTTIFLRAEILSPYSSLKGMTYYSKIEELTKPLVQYLADYDLRKLGNEYDVPVIMITGEYDWHMRLLAKEYFDTITAPYKSFVIIEGAGHVAMMDKPEQFFVELKRVLQESSKSPDI